MTYEHAHAYRLLRCLELFYRDKQKACSTLVWLAFRWDAPKEATK